MNLEGPLPTFAAQASDTVAKTALPVGITASSLWGITWEQWVYILTAIYTMAQLSWFIFKRYRDWRNGCGLKKRKNRRK